MPETIAQRRLHAIALLVPDYDQAIDWYVEVMGFDLVEDTPPPVNDGFWYQQEKAATFCSQASNDRQRGAIGDQAGGRVMMILHTDDLPVTKHTTKPMAHSSKKNQGMNPMASLRSSETFATGGPYQTNQ